MRHPRQITPPQPRLQTPITRTVCRQDHAPNGTLGGHTISEIEELFSITRSTVYRALARDQARATS
jgi:hypothetical protein